MRGLRTSCRVTKGLPNADTKGETLAVVMRNTRRDPVVGNQWLWSGARDPLRPRRSAQNAFLVQLAGLFEECHAADLPILC